MKAELEELKGPVRLRIADAIREAKSHGDLKENAAYHEAKLNQTRLESRIADLEKSFQFAKIVDGNEGEAASAQLGCKVTLLDIEFSEEMTILLVGSYEADPAMDFISILSPLGEAIVGCLEGDKIEVVAPGGATSYEILKILRED